MEGYEEFFKNTDTIQIVDWMAKRYGKLPHQILTELTVHEFNINAAIMLSAMTLEARDKQRAHDSVASGKAGEQFTTLKEFGIKVTQKTAKK